MASKDYNNSTLYKCPRQHTDMEHFVSAKATAKGHPGDATYGKPTEGTWKAGGGSYEDDD